MGGGIIRDKNMEVGEIVGRIGKLFKGGSNRPKEAEGRLLHPLLQKNKDIVDRFARTHDLKVVVWDGIFLLKKNEGSHSYQVINVIGNENLITVNVYKAGQDGYVIPVLNELLEPIYNKGRGNDVMVINRDIKDPHISGEIEYDTRKLHK